MYRWGKIVAYFKMSILLLYINWEQNPKLRLPLTSTKPQWFLCAHSQKGFQSHTLTNAISDKSVT